MEARETDTAKVTSAMGSESARILGSSARLGRWGWRNLEREGSMVRAVGYNKNIGKIEKIGLGRTRGGVG